MTLVLFLLLYRLTQLPTLSLSSAEQSLALTPIGWHGLAHNPFFLISKLQLSAAFYWFGQGGALVTRLPSVKLGFVSIIGVTILIRAWHGTKAAIFGCLLFACSAWLLHVSRYASWDSLYLSAVPIILVSQLALERLKVAWLPYIILLIWGFLLYTPGLIWFVLLAAWWDRDRFQAAWLQQRRWWQRLLLVVCGSIWLPLLVQFFVRQPRQFLIWLGAPARFVSWQDLLHHLAAVPLHLFIHGPAIPEQWLGQLPVLDIFTLTMTVLGIIYYTRHWRSGRSRLLFSYAALGTLLIGLGGPASLSLIIPLAYLAAAAGLAGLLRDWRQRFPLNPVLRTIGVTVVSVVVFASCAYNLQAYFVAWPHNPSTLSRFSAQR